MSDSTSKVIDYYERVRTDDPDAPPSPFSGAYDDVPWEAKVQMLRYADNHRRAKRPEPTAVVQLDLDPKTQAKVANGFWAAAVGGICGVTLLVFGWMLYSVVGMFRDGDWMAGAVVLCAIVGLVGLLGVLLLSSDSKESQP